MRFLAIVPAYNEVHAIGSVVQALRSGAPQFDVVGVDDGSTDANAELAEQGGATVIRLPFNLGISGAMQAGLRVRP